MRRMSVGVRSLAAVVGVSLAWLAGPPARADVTIQGKDGTVQLTLPAGWAETKPAAPAVQVMALDAHDDMGVLVIAEDRADLALTLDEYARRVVQQIADSGVMTDVSSTDLKPCRVAGHPAVRCDFKGTARSVKLGYVMTFVQGDRAFQAVEAWTTQSKLERRRAALQSLAEGVKETAPAAAGAGAGGGGTAAGTVSVEGKDHGVRVTLPGGFAQVPLPAGVPAAVQLMAGDGRTGMYLMVVTESRVDSTATLQQYGQGVLSAMAQNKANGDVTHTDLKPLKVDGHDALRCQLTSTTNGVKVDWLITVLQTERNFHQVNGWCVQSRFAANEAAMAKLPDGFREAGEADDAGGK